MIRTKFRYAALGAAAASVASLATAGEVTVIYSEIVTSPTSAVPGALDSAGSPVATTWLAIEDLAVRGDGLQWCIKGRTTQATTNDSILILGSGTGGTMFCQDDQPLQGGIAGEKYDFFDSGPPISWNANGDIGFSCRAKGGTASIFEKVISVIGGTHTVVHKMGDSFPGCQDIPANPTGDELFGNSIGSVNLLDNASFMFGNTPITNCSSFRYPGVFRGSSAFLQSGVTKIVVLTGVNETWDNTLYDGGGGTSDGLHYYWEGDTENTTTTIDGILVVDGVCVFQEGQLIPGTGVTFADAFATRMLQNGDWFSRGDDTADNDWAVRNGALITKTGDPIITGSTENWGVTIGAFTGNDAGDYIVVGNTTETDLTKDNVMVLNGEQVLHREGDPVDVDGNGLFDDDAFISTFQPDDVFITDDLEVFFLVTLRNAAAVTIGDAFLRDHLCGSATNFGAGCGGSGGFVPQLHLDGCIKAGGNVTLTIMDGLGGSTAILFFGFGQTATPMPGGCQLLVSPVPIFVTLPLGGSGAGQGSIGLPVLLPPGTAPVLFDMQAFVQDGGVFWGFSNSNGVEVDMF